jgi:hypothetical protein
MRRLVSLLFAAIMAVSLGAQVVGAQSAVSNYVSPTSTLRFSLPEGWEVQPTSEAPSAPVLELAKAVLPGESRAASVVVTQLKADISGMPMDEYKAALDQVVASGRDQMVSSSIEKVTTPSGQVNGVLQVLSVVRDDTAYDHVQFIVPMADREYTIGVTGLQGTTDANARTAGFIASTLVF